MHCVLLRSARDGLCVTESWQCAHCRAHQHGVVIPGERLHLDCSVCAPECPVDAIVNASEVSADQALFVALNAELARDPSWRAVTASRAPLAGHEAAARLSSTSDKLARLRRTW